MLSLEDKAIYYRLARDLYSFRGSVVDLGAYVGSTANALAMGILNNRTANWETLRTPLIHSFDHWEADSEEAVANLAYHFRNDPLRVGADLLPYFKRLTEPFAAMIQTHKGYVEDGAYRIDRPIEILSVDICKSRQTTDIVFREFMPKLAPGAIVLHQDFIHPWHPYLHTAIGFFRDHFEVLTEGAEGSTVAYRLVRPIAEGDMKGFSETCLRDRSQWLPLQQQAMDQLTSARAKRSSRPAQALLIAELKGLAAMREAIEPWRRDRANSDLDRKWFDAVAAYAERGFV